MKRVWIAGSSGSGKTTLAEVIGEKYHIPVYHRDSITWGENAQMRTEQEQIEITRGITQMETWIFEGARFTASKVDGRLERCDTIIYLDINRFLCLYRVIKRALAQFMDRRIPRAEIQAVRLDLIQYILFEYPRKVVERQAVFLQAEQKGINVLILKGRKAVIKFCREKSLIYTKF